MLVHASSVVIGNKAVLLAGPPGSGKSDLALRLIDEGAKLLSDDQTLLQLENGVLMASPPASIEGLIEIRHVGIAVMPFAASAPVVLYVELTDINAVLERLPEPDPIFFLDRPVERLRLPSFAASTPAKIRAVLTASFK
ncbi:MAG: HPr kinase/phosphatase C-terminal domain-containing protein [Bdellovibrionales bacterium]